jgi:thioredoxin-related protein
MKIKSLISALFCCLLLSGAALAEAQWYTDWDKAEKASKAQNKPILMDFTGSDWCGWCIKLHDEVFSTSAFQTWADKNVILLEVDFPRKSEMTPKQKAANEALAKKYGVQGFPTIVFASADGSELGRYGYDKGGPEVWTKKASEMIKK